MSKYKLCRLEMTTTTKVVPITTKGIQYLDSLMSFEEDNDEYCYYSIYENLGDDENEDWEEYMYYGDDFDKAVEEYEKLTKGEK